MALWIDANDAQEFCGAAGLVIVAKHINCAEQCGRHQHVAFHKVGVQAQIDIQFQKIVEECV